MGTCLDCDTNIEIGEDTEIGDTLACPKCNARLEVLDVNPVILDYADEDDL